MASRPRRSPSCGRRSNGRWRSRASGGAGTAALALLMRDEGATLDQLVEATGRAKPTAQTFLGRVLKARGLRAVSEKPAKDGPRVYRAVAA